ncbi:MAG: CvpA family protein [Deltaproteobacteria bacterium]|jgi:membrane protein required for colicin V production|nr:CvpA family protein [Deltaproteobacteria bacterium]
MSPLDIAIIVILAYFLVRGIFRGLVKEVVGVLGLFVALWAAGVYWRLGADQLKPVFNSELYRSVLSFVIIYLVVYFFVGLMSVFVDKIVKMTITPVCSGIFGAVLGLMKGAVLCLVVLTASTAFLDPDNTFYTNSYSWTVMEPLCQKVKEWMPDELKLNISAPRPAVSGDLRGSRPPASVPAPPDASNPNQTRRPTLPTNHQEVVALARQYPELVKPEWRDRVYSVSPETVDTNFIRSFVEGNPDLFSGGPPAGGTPPSWPSPARE